MRTAIIVAILIGVFTLIYLSGDRPDGFTPEFSIREVPENPEDLKTLIDNRESQTAGLKPDNNARINFANTEEPQKEACAIIYLHGFMASPGEAKPLHKQVAGQLGCNLYLPRFSGHGIKNISNVREISAADWFDDILEAKSVGARLGEEVILMGNSMGGLAALWLASQSETVSTLVLFAPLIEPQIRFSGLLSGPWAYQFAGLISDRGYVQTDPDNEKHEQYWHTRYPSSALVELAVFYETLIDATDFSEIHQPVFTGYYYRSEDEKDELISVEAVDQMMEQLGTEEELKKTVRFSDAEKHVITSPARNKNWKTVRSEVLEFLDN